MMTLENFDLSMLSSWVLLVPLMFGLVFLHETITQERTLNAAENGPFDLAVNPISFMLLHVRAEAGVNPADFLQLIGHIQSFSVSFKGTQIINLSGVDLVRYVHYLWGRSVPIENFGVVSPGLVSFTIPIPFARKPYWSKEGFPATRRGELTYTVTRTAALTNIANPVFSVECVQMLEAEPTQFLKCVTLSRAIAVGDADFELPIGNPFIGIQIFAPTAMGNAPISETIRRMRLLFDNVEYDYSDTAFDVARTIGWLRGADFNNYVGQSSLIRNYAYLDFDPLQDDTMMVETDGRASVKLRMVPDVGGTVRVMPVELVKLPGAAA
jgi:hypothetical protein